jgi:UDP-glucuronate 4-epimerase
MAELKVGVTGAAGFIGMHLAKHLTELGHTVIGIDNLAPSYKSKVTAMRVDLLKGLDKFELIEIDISDNANLNALESKLKNVDVLIHLAAWPGVRLGQEKPYEYTTSNLGGFGNILEVVKRVQPKKFMFASSSSVYGDLARNGPVRESEATGLNLKSLYAATKWSNELLAFHYQKITNIPTIALRFFTVFGEYGRPDMAYWSFLEKMTNNQPIQLYGETGGIRNYTYIDDAIEILTRIMVLDLSGYEALNISSGEPITTKSFLDNVSRSMQISPILTIIERPEIDVEITWSDRQKLESLIGKIPETPIEYSIENLTAWYKDF